ncbi:alpha-ketoglutarate-dependent dioxygenase AlkB [Xanthomonas sp. GPE 39]|uniref:alpha-ketoglutarate-dependent dioxygenase AlkB family protein n=1 Tax=Xanthomonas sp. GPE 39 TaxID=1583099 RepID=UPI0005F2C7BB|nr:alpha-ketoglutarate-dependent dioxygenase AlkB [Xanthomonas sp. GPE 39]
MELHLPGAEIRWLPDWLAPEEATLLFAQLLVEVRWEVHRIQLFGRLVDSPRLSCWIGDPEASYRYSGTRFAPHPWPAVLLPLRERLTAETGVAFNSVLANRYRNGRDAMGWHSDDEKELGPNPLIASLSLGASRRFVLRHRSEPRLRQALELSSGGLLLMAGDTQRLYRHALPRTARPVGERINLTFRTITAV